ncbi:MAG: hypothetical protein IPP53_07030 [Bacteroidetes bacterium]|nr:hypothetical protein [Bacteroidota bacterium]
MSYPEFKQTIFGPRFDEELKAPIGIIQRIKSIFHNAFAQTENIYKMHWLSNGFTIPFLNNN